MYIFSLQLRAPLPLPGSPFILDFLGSLSSSHVQAKGDSGAGGGIVVFLVVVLLLAGGGVAALVDFDVLGFLFQLFY